jgi:methionyl-tRNA synthetase
MMHDQIYYTDMGYGHMAPMYAHYNSGGFDALWFLLPALAILGPLFILVIAWSLFWKGLALWHSARRNEPLWFIALLIVNTFGIFEIIYLFFFAKLKLNELFSKHEHR